MTTFTNSKLSTIAQEGTFIGNVDGNDVFAVAIEGTDEHQIIIHKGGDILKGLAVTTQFPSAYALFLIKGYKGSVTINPEQVAKKDRKPLTTTTRREMEEAISRFNLGVSAAPIQPGVSTMESQGNILDPEDVINTLDTNYRLSGYLKLRGHISYKAAKLAGQYMAKEAKALMDAASESGIDAFNAAMGQVRGLDTDNILLDEMGLEAHTEETLFETIRSLVLYANKLNFDIQKLYDPSGKLREDPTFKKPGVFFDEDGRKDSWAASVKLVANKDQDKDADEKYKRYVNDFKLITKTAADQKTDKVELVAYLASRKTEFLDRPSWDYKQYFDSVENKEWALTREEWDLQNDGSENELFVKFEDHIVELLLDFGGDEGYFDNLPTRTQIAAIENMRGKIPELLTSALKSVKFARGVLNRNTEATTVKGLVGGFNKMFCSMLSSSRYANHTEFMYNFAPVKMSADNKPVSRRMIARNEDAARALNNTRKVETVKAEDFLELESDVV